MYLPYGPVCYSKGPHPHPEAGLFCLLFSVSPPCYSRHRLCYAGAAAPPPYIALRHHPASPISVPPPSRRPCSSVSVPFTGTTSCIPLSVSPSSCHVLPWPLSASPPLRISASAPLARPPLHISPRSSAVPPSSTSVSTPPARPPLRISPPLLCRTAVQHLRLRPHCATAPRLSPLFAAPYSISFTNIPYYILWLYFSR